MPYSEYRHIPKRASALSDLDRVAYLQHCHPDITTIFVPRYREKKRTAVVVVPVLRTVHSFFNNRVLIRESWKWLEITAVSVIRL